MDWMDLLVVLLVSSIRTGFGIKEHKMMMMRGSSSLCSINFVLMFHEENAMFYHLNKILLVFIVYFPYNWHDYGTKN